MKDILLALDSIWRDENEGHLIWEGSRDLDCVKYVINEVHPQNILETGFCAGHSSLMWLTHSHADVTSMDCCKLSFTMEAVKLMEKCFPDRFNFIPADTREWKALVDLLGVYEKPFDLMFIDADHNYEGVRADTNIALGLGIPWLFYDDYREGVKECIEESVEKKEIEIFELIDPIAPDGRLMVLCKNIKEYNGEQ